MSLDAIRQEIDRVDQELVALLEKRTQLANQAAVYKKATGKPIPNTSREDAVPRRAASHIEDGALEQTIVSTLADIMKNSHDYRVK